jgi:hypothetical protein
VGVGKKGLSNAVMRTADDATYYVRTTGDDSNDGLTVGTALRHPQAAIDKAPQWIGHDIVIDIGEGTFNGVEFAGYNLGKDGTFTMQGTLGTPTLDGASSGTGEAGSTVHQLVDSTANWTTDELRGKLMKVNSEYVPIYSNTADTVQFTGAFSSTTNGQSYEVLEHKTVLNTGVFSGVVTAVGNFQNVRAHTSESWTIKNIKFDGDTPEVSYTFLVYATTGGVLMNCDFFGGSVGSLVLQNSSEINVRSCTIHDAYYGILALRNPSIRDMKNSWSFDNASSGWYISGCMELNADRFSSSDNGDHGIVIHNVGWMLMIKGYCENNGKYGIFVGSYDSTKGTYVGNCVVDLNAGAGLLKLGSCTLGGIFCGAGSIVFVNGATGTVTGTYGITCEDGGCVFVNDNVDVTGATGDATINGGTTTLGWSSDFASDGDVVHNLDTGSRITRKD